MNNDKNELNNDKKVSAHPDPVVPNTNHQANENAIPMTEAPDPVVPNAEKAVAGQQNGPNQGIIQHQEIQIQQDIIQHRQNLATTILKDQLATHLFMVH